MSRKINFTFSEDCNGSRKRFFNSTRNSYVTWTIHRKFPLSIYNWVMSNFIWKTVMVDGRFKHYYWPPKYNSGKFMLQGWFWDLPSAGMWLGTTTGQDFFSWVSFRLSLWKLFQPLSWLVVSFALFWFCSPSSGVIPLTGLVVLNAREVLLMNIILNCCEFPPWSLFFLAALVLCSDWL